MTAWPRRANRVVRPLSNMWMSVASRSPNNVSCKVTWSPTRSLRTSASLTGSRMSWLVIALEPELDALGREGCPRATGGVALDVDGDRVHGDVGRRRLDVHRERRRIAAESLRADAEAVDRLGQFLLQLRPFRVVAGGAERPRRRHLGEMCAQIRGAADADA